MIAKEDRGVDLAYQETAAATTGEALTRRKPAVVSAAAGSPSAAGAKSGSQSSAGIRSAGRRVVGEDLTPFWTEFNGSLRIESRSERLTSEAEAVILRKVVERLGIVPWMVQRLRDPRNPQLVDHPLAELPHTALLLIAELRKSAGYLKPEEAAEAENRVCKPKSFTTRVVLTAPNARQTTCYEFTPSLTCLTASSSK